MSVPAAMYLPIVQTGNLCFVSGQIPTKDGKLVYYPIYMVMFLKEDEIRFPDLSVERFSFQPGSLKA